MPTQTTAVATSSATIRQWCPTPAQKATTSASVRAPALGQRMQDANPHVSEYFIETNLTKIIAKQTMNSRLQVSKGSHWLNMFNGV